MTLRYAPLLASCFALALLAAPVVAPAQAIYPALGDCPAVGTTGAVRLLAASGDRVVYYDEGDSEDFRGSLYLLDGYQPDGAVLIAPDVPRGFRFDIETDELLAYPQGSLLRALTPADPNPRTVFEAPGDIVAITRWRGAYYVAYSVGFSDESVVRVDPVTAQAGPVLYTAGFGGIVSMGALDDGVVVVANGPRGADDSRGEREVVRLGATPEMTTRIGTLALTDPEGNPLSSGGPATRVGDRLFFFVVEPSTDENRLYVTDGSDGSVERLGVYHPDLFERALPPIAFEDELYFFLREFDSPSGLTHQVHRSDGTVAGTETLGDGDADFYLDPYSATVFGGYLYFTGINGFRRTNASVVGSELVFAEAPLGQLEDASEVVAFNDSLLLGGYVTADPVDYDYELYSSDGTGAGSRRVREFDGREGGDGSPRNFVVAGRRAYFIADRQGSTNQPYVYDLDLATPPFVSTAVDSVTVAADVVTVYASGEGLAYTLGDRGSDSGVFADVGSGTYAYTVTDAKGCVVGDSVTVDRSTGVADRRTLAAYRLRTNPVAPGAPLGLEATETLDAVLASIGVFATDGRRVSVQDAGGSAVAPATRGHYTVVGYGRGGRILARAALIVE